MTEITFIEGEDYYYNDEGKLVLTAAFHKKRGFCCGNGCIHCPYDHVNVKDSRQKNIK